MFVKIKQIIYVFVKVNRCENKRKWIEEEKKDCKNKRHVSASKTKTKKYIACKNTANEVKIRVSCGKWKWKYRKLEVNKY